MFSSLNALGVALAVYCTVYRPLSSLSISSPSCHVYAPCIQHEKCFRPSQILLAMKGMMSTDWCEKKTEEIIASPVFDLKNLACKRRSPVNSPKSLFNLVILCRGVMRRHLDSHRFTLNCVSFGDLVSWSSDRCLSKLLNIHVKSQIQPRPLGRP
jgi:hypothetical protein